MIDVLTQLVVWLSSAADALGRWLLLPIGVVPGWLALTVISVITGVLLLAVFKYTSNQRAIKRVRNDISANLLALKLFKDSARVAVQAQDRLLRGAVRLFFLALVPMLVMAVPVCLLVAQLALWYQSKPLQVDDEAVMIMKLNGDSDSPWPDVRLQPTQAMEVTTGPVRVQSKRWICWEIKAREAGNHRLVFRVNGQPIDKELTIGEGYMRVSTQRPGWSCKDALENPAEKPFSPDSPVQSITIEYPKRASWSLWGISPWMIYWFVVSMVAGFCFSRVMNVNI